MTETGVDYAYPDQEVTTVRTDGGQVVWYVPEAPYVVLVDTGSGVSGCIVYGPYGWLEAGRVAERLGGYARSVVSSDHVTGVQTPVSDSTDQVQIEHESP